jgi:transcription antitermination factor NusG
MNYSTLHPEVDSWIVLRTSARWEKNIAVALSGSGVPIFLPTTRTGTQHSSRYSEVPLFAGYLFCSEYHFVDNPKVPASCRKQIAQVLRPPHPALLKQELTEIAEFLCDHQLVQERVYGKKGSTVRVIAGAFTGYEGIIIGLDPKKRRIVLEISFLNVRVAVEVEEHVVSNAE